MRTAILTKFSGSAGLTIKDTPKPQSRKGEALIKVKACGLNHLDLWVARGSKGASTSVKLPHILGSDVAGVIETINGPSRLKPDQAVIVNPSLPRPKNQPVGIFGFHTPGGYAQYVTAPVKNLYPKPKNLSFIQAAAFPLTFLTAWRMLTTKAKLKRNETVFIWGASGGLGLAGLTIAKYLGAKVIAATKSVSIAKKLKTLGADAVVIYPQGKVVNQVKKLTGQNGADVVFESVGKKTWQDSLEMLKFGGRVVIAGTTSGDMGTQNLSEVYYRQLTILGSRMGNQKEFEQVLKLIGQGKLKPVIDTTLPLKDASKALTRMKQGKHLGKIILKI